MLDEALDGCRNLRARAKKAEANLAAWLGRGHSWRERAEKAEAEVRRLQEWKDTHCPQCMFEGLERCICHV